MDLRDLWTLAVKKGRTGDVDYIAEAMRETAKKANVGPRALKAAEVGAPIVKAGAIGAGSILKKGAKIGGIGGLVIGAAVALPFLSSMLNNKRRFNAGDAIDPEMSQPLPDVMNFTPATAAPEKATMMGMQPVEGMMAQKVKAERGGIEGGVNPVPPTVERFGQSVIDGKPVEDLSPSRA